MSSCSSSWGRRTISWLSFMSTTTALWSSTGGQESSTWPGDSVSVWVCLAVVIQFFLYFNKTRPCRGPVGLLTRTDWSPVLQHSSSASSTPSSTSWCTLTTAWLPSALTCRSTCGGSDTSHLCSWWVCTRTLQPPREALNRDSASLP